MVVQLLMVNMSQNTYVQMEHMVTELVLLAMDDLYRPICYYRLAKGIEDSVQVDIRTLFQVLLAVRANRFIIAHNHPTGIPLPSYADISFAHNISIESALLGFDFVDGIIIGKLAGDKREKYRGIKYPRHYSLRGNGHLLTGDFPD